MLSVMRHTVPEEDQAAFLDDAAEALDALGRCPGYLRGRVGRAVDDPLEWAVVIEWENVGSCRRALSSYDVRVRMVPLLATGQAEPVGFEVLLDSETGSRPSDRAG